MSFYRGFGAATFASVTTVSLYQPHAIDASLPFPTEWNELSLEELHIVSKAFLSDFSQEQAGRVTLFCELLAYRAAHHKVKLPMGFTGKLDPEDTAINGLQLVDFIYQENHLTRQPYPKLTLRTTGLMYANLKGPVDEFDSLSCGEFEDAEIFFYKFRHEPDAEPLARLASILWREKEVPYLKYNASKSSYEHYDAERMYPFFLRLSPWILYTMFTWYAGCRNILPQLFPLVFEGGDKKSGEPDFVAFTKCIHSGAGAKNGSRDHIRTTPLKEFFFEMELEAQKAKELKQYYEQLK